MNEITYLSPIKQETYPNGQKPAKISQEKIKRLISGYKKNLQVASPVVTNAIPSQAPAPIVSEAPSTPVVNQPQPVVETKVVDNYEEVADNFKISAYKKSFDELPLAGVKKIRTAAKVPKHIKGYKNKMANGVLKNVEVASRPVATTPLVEEKVEPAVNNAIEQPKPTPVVNEYVQKESASPSVDDYLQKEVPNTNIAQLIKQQEEKNASLRAEKEAKERQLEQKRIEKEQRQQQAILEQLREEELGLTRAIEGLDAEMLREEAEMVSMGRGR